MVKNYSTREERVYADLTGCPATAGAVTHAKDVATGETLALLKDVTYRLQVASANPLRFKTYDEEAAETGDDGTVLAGWGEMWITPDVDKTLSVIQISAASTLNVTVMRGPR